MSERAPYSRVYWGIADDPKFLTIFDDDRHLATWLRLLLIADQAHPASGHLPANARKVSVSALAVADLITLTGSRFRVKGLDAERARRAEAGRVGGLASGRSRTVEQTFPDRSPVQGTKTNLAETRQAETSRDEYARDVATKEPIDRIVDVWLSVKYRLPSDKQRAFLYAYLQTFDVSGAARAERLILSNPADPIAAMKDDLAAFRGERIKELGAEVEKPAPRRRPGLPQTTREILAEMQRLDAERGAA